MEIKTHPATKAFIVYDGKVLLVRESSNYGDGTNRGKFDVIGGRVNPGQRFDESFLREVREETGLEVTLGDPFYIGEWRPIIRGEPWQIVGTFIECFSSSDQVLLSEDHDRYIWIDPQDYLKYELIESIRPAFKKYLNRTH